MFRQHLLRKLDRSCCKVGRVVERCLPSLCTGCVTGCTREIGCSTTPGCHKTLATYKTIAEVKNHSKAVSLKPIQQRRVLNTKGHAWGKLSDNHRLLCTHALCSSEYIVGTYTCTYTRGTPRTNYHPLLFCLSSIGGRKAGDSGHVIYRHFSTSDISKAQNVKKADKVEESQEDTHSSSKESIKDNIFTVPNFLTTSRIVLSPIIGYQVLNGDFTWACSLFVFAGLTDLLDGYIARHFPNQTSALGSFIDPLADKCLVSVLFVTLTMVDLIPLALTGMIIVRDIALAAAAFYIRYISLPPPVTLSAYFDMTNASAQLQPLLISKLNTAVQLCLVAVTLGAPVLGYVDHPYLHSLWYLTAGTTVASGIAYMFAKDTFKIIKKHRLDKSKSP